MTRSIRGPRSTRQTGTRRLRTELACYTSTSDRLDLQMALTRFPDADTQQVRDLLPTMRSAEANG